MNWPDGMPKRMEILWMDAHSRDEWHDELNGNPQAILSVGWVVKETDEAFVLAGMYDHEEKQYACVQTIPKACIKKKRQAR